MWAAIGDCRRIGRLKKGHAVQKQAWPRFREETHPKVRMKQFRERGGTHNRFIISYQTLRRPEYRDPLLATLGDRAKKTMLILDEAHTAAPASSTRTGTTRRRPG